MTTAVLFDPSATAQVIDTFHHAFTLYKRHLEKLPAESFGQPSNLPEWKNAHVIAHVDNFSRGVLNQLEAAKMGEFRDFYEGGQDERNRRIELGALMQPEALRTRALESMTGVFEALSTADDAYLDQPTRFQGSIRRIMLACIREYGIHSVDLKEGAQPIDWTQEMVRHYIDFGEKRVPDSIKLNLQRLGGQSHVIGHGDRTIVVQGLDFDIATWLMGRNPSGQIRATAAADGVALPELLPWPKPHLLTPDEERALAPE